LTRGANDSIDCLFAFICWDHVSTVDHRSGGVSYLAIIQDEAETSGDRLERTKRIRGFLDPIQDQFGPRICERFEL
jgi:hypothetical protein